MKLILQPLTNLTKEYANVVFELSHLASNIKHEIVRILDFLGSFFNKYEEKKPLYVFLNVGS
jgi:hypothetical protein